MFLRGVPVPEIQGQLRHNDPRSLRTYLDAVSLMANHVSGDAARWTEFADLVDKHWWQLLNGSSLPWVVLEPAAPVSLNHLWARPQIAFQEML